MALSRAVSRARFLHIATHGWFVPQVTSARRQRVWDQSQLVAELAPDALCGLALAGANGDGALGRGSGTLSAEELAGWDLSSCELAVLSACESHAGLRTAGQGVRSLHTALHSAGARAVITSLWRIDDALAERFMRAFYTELWRERRTQSEALARAKAVMRSEGHGTRAWAGWILTGGVDSE